jgi:hypothetical protein
METVKSFFGLNNISNPLRLGMKWLARADNVNVSDTGAVQKRDGYTKTISGAFTSAFSTFDFARMYLVEGLTLKAMTGQSVLAIKSLQSSALMYWAEINNQVFYNNGVDTGIVLSDNAVIPWSWPMPDAPRLAAVTGNLPAGLYRVLCTQRLADGRETGGSEIVEIDLLEGQSLQISNIPTGATVYIAPANSTVFQSIGTPSSATVWNSSPDMLGVDLLNGQLSPLPQGVTVIQAWKGRMYAAQHMPEADQTVLWVSQPLGFHLFDLDTDFVLIQGKVLMLAAHDDALIVGTDKRIYAYDGNTIVTLAEYGVAPGQHASKDDTRILFWSNRGLCAALPFVNLMESRFLAEPCESAGGALIQRGSSRRYVAATKQLPT